MSLSSPLTRITLSVPQPADDGAILKIYSTTDAVLHLAVPVNPFTPAELAARRFKRSADPTNVDFVIRPPGDAEAVGVCSLTISPLWNTAAAGIVLSQTQTRSGYATEALYLLLDHGFSTLNLHRVNFETSAENSGMRGWLENVLGIEVEYRQREAWKYLAAEGQPERRADMVGYGILKREWPALKERIARRLEEKRGITSSEPGHQPLVETNGAEDGSDDEEEEELLI